MTADITIYHNPRCSKSRATLELLREHGHEPRIINYLETPPDAEELESILENLELEPRDLMRTHEKEYQVAGADNPELSRKELIRILHDYPRLIERPIVIARGKAVIGRPPGKVLKII